VARMKKNDVGISGHAYVATCWRQQNPRSAKNFFFNF